MIPEENIPNPSYLVILIERQYLAQLVNGLAQQKQVLKQILNKNKYDVKASAELPKVTHDLRETSQILLAYNNIINCRLQDVYKFDFQSIETQKFEKGGHDIPSEQKDVEFSKEADDNQDQ